MGAYEEIKCRRSIVSDTLQSLTEQVALWRQNLDRVEAGKKLDLADAIGQLTKLLDTCQNLRDAILSEDSAARWDTKEELHALFFELRDRMGQTFVIVTHDEQLARNTDRVIHITDGLVL